MLKFNTKKDLKTSLKNRYILIKNSLLYLKRQAVYFVNTFKTSMACSFLSELTMIVRILSLEGKSISLSKFKESILIPYIPSVSFESEALTSSSSGIFKFSKPSIVEISSNISCDTCALKYSSLTMARSISLAAIFIAISSVGVNLYPVFESLQIGLISIVDFSGFSISRSLSVALREYN